MCSLFLKDPGLQINLFIARICTLENGADPDQLVPEVSSSCLTPFYLDNESTLIIRLHHGFQIGKSFTVSYQSKT